MSKIIKVDYYSHREEKEFNLNFTFSMQAMGANYAAFIVEENEVIYFKYLDAIVEFTKEVAATGKEVVSFNKEGLLGLSYNTDKKNSDFVTVRGVKDGQDLPSPVVYKSNQYIVTNPKQVTNLGMVLHSGDADSIKKLGTYFDDMIVLVRTHDFYRQDNEKVESSNVDEERATCQKAVEILRSCSDDPNVLDPFIRATRLKYAEVIELQMLVGTPVYDKMAFDLSNLVIEASEKEQAE